MFSFFVLFSKISWYWQKCEKLTRNWILFQFLKLSFSEKAKKMWEIIIMVLMFTKWGQLCTWFWPSQKSWTLRTIFLPKYWISKLKQSVIRRDWFSCTDLESLLISLENIGLCSAFWGLQSISTFVLKHFVCFKSAELENISALKLVLRKKRRRVMTWSRLQSKYPVLAALTLCNSH